MGKLEGGGCLVPEKQQAVGPWQIFRTDAVFTRARKAMARSMVRKGELLIPFHVSISDIAGDLVHG